METNQKSLPSEKLQKEFEANPLKILENIRKEKEEKSDEIKTSKKDVNSNEISLSNENYISFKKENNKNIFSKTFDFFINEKNQNKSLYNKKNKKDSNSNINYNVNNINSNLNKMDCKYNYINNNSNIIYNNYDNVVKSNMIIFNFNNINQKTDYVNNNKNIIKNNECKNNNIFFANNSEETNSTSSQSIDDDNINTKNICNIFTKKNKDKLLILSNINLLLDNLKTFKGSIVSQEFIDNITDVKECSILFNNIMPHICTIMCLEYGNYFFQKFLKKLNLEQKLIIYQVIEPNFYIIATNQFGTHSIQSLINNIESQYELMALSRLISKNMYFLFINNNSYHIMMKIILDFPEDQRNFINLYLVMNADKIITNCNGAFCINKFIINNKNLKLRALLIQNLKNNIKQLIFNKYCCINLLLILEKFGIDWGNFIIKEIQENFEILGKNPVSNLFINKVLLFLKNNYLFE